jgi:hypothetical protein
MFQKVMAIIKRIITDLKSMKMGSPEDLVISLLVIL